MNFKTRLAKVEKRLREEMENLESIPRFVTAEEAEELRAQGKFVKTIYPSAGGICAGLWPRGVAVVYGA